MKDPEMTPTKSRANGPVLSAMSAGTCPKGHVTRRAGRRATLALLALAACRPEPAAVVPGPSEPAPTDPAVTAGPATTDPTPIEPTPAPTTQPVASAADPPPPATADPPAVTPTPTPAIDRTPLPAALNTKIDATCGNDPGVGTAAKAFTLKTPDGKDISLASYRGKVVLLNFWGTWCKPCLKELPEFDRLYRRYRKHGMVLIAIATDTEPEKVVEFAERSKLAAKLALGGEPLAEQYESTNFPFSLVIDAKGQIRGSYRGYRPECAGKLEQDLRAQLELR